MIYHKYSAVCVFYKLLCVLVCPRPAVTLKVLPLPTFHYEKLNNYKKIKNIFLIVMDQVDQETFFKLDKKLASFRAPL